MMTMTTTTDANTQSHTGQPCSEPTPTPTPPAPTLEPHVQAACDIAAGRVAADPAAPTVQVRAAAKDYSARGRCREHWYRMVWSGSDWRYCAERRLASGEYRAADRHDTVYGHVSIGDLVARHDHGGPIDAVWVVTDLTAKPLRRCDFAVRRDGRLSIALPDGTVIDRPNPRRRM